MKIFFTFLMMIVLGGCKEEQTVYVYSGPGASENAVQHTIYTLTNLLDTQYKIQTIQPKEVIEGQWTKNAVLFVLPGGADLPYVKDLTPYGNQVIKKYVEEGGSFLGICAGAYYSGNYIEFDVGGPLEVKGTRELAFFPGVVNGPVLKKYDYKTNAGAQVAELRVPNSKIENAKVYYNGGGYFVNAHKYDNVKIIANYPENQAAIIHMPYGKGIVILSGVHFEYAPELLDQKDLYLKEIVPELINHASGRIQLGKSLLNMLRLEAK